MAKTLKKLAAVVKDVDIYGSPIGVHYKGNDSYKTWLGSLCTIAIYVLMVVNLT